MSVGFLVSEHLRPVGPNGIARLSEETRSKLIGGRRWCPSFSQFIHHSQFHPTAISNGLCEGKAPRRTYRPSRTNRRCFSRQRPLSFVMCRRCALSFLTVTDLCRDVPGKRCGKRRKWLIYIGFSRQRRSHNRFVGEQPPYSSDAVLQPKFGLHLNSRHALIRRGGSCLVDSTA
jgi:hypothetical protein